MSHKNNNNQPSSNSFTFWKAYQKVLNGNRIFKKNAEWHRRRAEQFLIYLPDFPSTPDQ